MAALLRTLFSTLRFADAWPPPAWRQVHWVDLHDALTTMLTHGKEVPTGAPQSWATAHLDCKACLGWPRLHGPHVPAAAPCKARAVGGSQSPNSNR